MMWTVHAQSRSYELFKDGEPTGVIIPFEPVVRNTLENICDLLNQYQADLIEPKCNTCREVAAGDERKRRSHLLELKLLERGYRADEHPLGYILHLCENDDSLMSFFEQLVERSTSLGEQK